MASPKTSTLPRRSVYLEPFAAWPRATDSAWCPALRRSGLEHFEQAGLPTTQDEDWRFTPLTPFTRLPFRPLLNPPALLPSLEQLDHLSFGRQHGPRLVFVDGHLAPALSRVGELPEGVFLAGLSECARPGGEPLPAELGQYVPPADSAFAALNAAYFTDGVILRVPPETAIQTPIRLVHITTAPEAGSAAHLRHFIQVGRGSQLTVIGMCVSLTGAAHVTNLVTELAVEEGARLEWVSFQDENPAAVHLATLGGTFGKSSQAWVHSFALGSRLSRTNIRTHLGGPGLECVLNGLYLTRNQQLADHHMIVEHAAPHCASHEYFNGILDDRSRGVFHGRILVRQAAQKTDAKQTNKNILLSDEAQVNTKPQLEIYADDVKCTHGATIGQLDEDCIFYLRARGLGLESARQLLIHAFAGEIIERVQHESVREELDHLIRQRLEQNPHLHVEGGPEHV
jgi:Fe-S cluster assembly protein SufD